jgi:uncharacterized repeat protein (TIGR01451 family)
MRPLLTKYIFCFQNLFFPSRSASCRKSALQQQASKWLVCFVLGLLMVLVSHIPVWSEGTEVLNTAGVTSTNGVYLFEYGANNTFVQPPHARPLYVNIANPTDIINISLCGWDATDDLGIEIFQTSGSPTFATGTELNYTTAVVAGSPGALGTGQWNLTDGNARTATQTTICTTRTKPTTPVGVLTAPVRFRVPAAGTYEIRLHNDTIANTSGDAVFTFFDVTVTANATTNPNPAATNGQLWSRAWAFNAGNSFAVAGAYDADFYVRTPGGRPNTEFRWQLDLNRFAPQRHEIIANGIGMDAPNSRYSVASGTYTRNFPIYLAYPTAMPFLPLLPEPAAPNIQSFRFIDSDGQDNTITPNPATAAVQDTGNFEFLTDVDGTYELTIDTNQNGVFGPGDRVLFGPVTANVLQQVTWNGTGPTGAALPTGTYPVQLQIRIGEYHFVTFDAETSGGIPAQTGSSGGNGLSIWKATGAASRTPTQVYWDDQTFLSANGGTSNLPAGGASNTDAGRHTWGNFGGTGVGDTRFMDTWVYGASQQLVEPAIIADIDQNDFGDAPDSYGTNKANSGPEGIGASHILSTTIRLGTVVTDEELPSQDGQPNAAANGDDINGTDDEDGVTSFAPLLDSSTTYTVGIRAQNTSGANAYLGGWIDFNRDGRFSATEGVVQTIPTGTNGNVNIAWTGLTGLVPGNTYARFRINNDPLTVNSFVGGGRNGEVEDYALIIRGAASPLDYGDAPDAAPATGAGNYNTTLGEGGPSHLIATNLKLGGNAPDADSGTLQDVNALADDANQAPDDEDGVTLPTTLRIDSTTYSATVSVTNTIGTPATLVGWIDFNRNGVFEASEGRLQTVADNVNNGTVTLTWPGLSGLTRGDTYARFRLSNGSLTTSTPTGLLGSGEVEDYKINIADISGNLLLVKRITAINQTATPAGGPNFATYIDDPANPYDDNVRTVAAPINPTDPLPDTTNWPMLSSFMLGQIQGGFIKPTDTADYTIYFLSDGNVNANNVLICDYVPANTTFVANAYNASPPAAPGGTVGSNRGITLSQGSSTVSFTNVSDGDGGHYFAPTIDPALTFPGIDCEGDRNGINANPNGAVVVSLGSLPYATSVATPPAPASYGYMRFRVTVQ